MRLARSKTVEACVAMQWLRHAIGRNETEDDEHSLTQLRCGMGEKEPRFVDMLAAFTRTDSFRYFSATQGGK